MDVRPRGGQLGVTNEGNAELTTTPPRVHIVTAGIEKLVPSTAHAFALLRLLVRSATGGELTQYTTFHCGPKRPGDADGPEEMDIVLVEQRPQPDAGGRVSRDAALHPLRRLHEPLRRLSPDRRPRLRRDLSGPDGRGPDFRPRRPRSVAGRVPFACTMNGRCAEGLPGEQACPRPSCGGPRVRSWHEGLEKGPVRAGLGLWAAVARRPGLYRLSKAPAFGRFACSERPAGSGSLPLAGGWTKHRDLPAPAGGTFMQRYKAERAEEIADDHPGQHPRRGPRPASETGAAEPAAIAAEAAALLADPDTILTSPRCADA